MTDQPKIPQELHHLQGAAAVEGIFAWAAEIGQAAVAANKAKRATQRAARNSRARAKYAAQRKAGKLTRKLKADKPQYDAPECCYCMACAMPPSSWCENHWRDHEE